MTKRSKTRHRKRRNGVVKDRKQWRLITALCVITLVSVIAAARFRFQSGLNQDLQSDAAAIDSAKQNGMSRTVFHANTEPTGPATLTSPIVSTSTSISRLARFEDQLDPQKSGWPTEAFSEAATSQLQQIAKLLGQPTKIVPEKLTEIAGGDFECGLLRPRGLQEAFRDPSLVVSRTRDARRSAGSEMKHTGASGLAKALKSMVAPLGSANHVRAKFKIVEVTMAQATATTKAYFEASGTTEQGSFQQNATWHCQWVVHKDQPPQLASIEVDDYEETLLRATDKTIFSDCTESVLADNESFERQLVYGLPHWVKRIELRHAINTFARYGGSVGDANGDGLEDLYVCQPGGLPNRLFLQNKDGTATDHSQAAGVDVLDCSTSAIFVDLDNDGDQDLIVTIWYELLVFENDSLGRFTLQTRLPTIHRDVQSLSATDYDNDGRVDLYVTVDMTVGDTRADEAGGRFLYHDANDGSPNLLYRNQTSADQWLFVDVTQKVGLDVNNRRHSLAAAWEDFDNDGDMDLYVANDFGQNCLYRNDDGHFVDIAPVAGVVDHGSGMSVSWGDYDRDGRMDLYVGNMFSSAGNRITSQENFKANASEATRTMYRRMAKGNTLFHNNGDGTFREHVGARVEMGRWAWSSLFADINNDGWDDLLVANGYLTTDDTGDL